MVVMFLVAFLLAQDAAMAAMKKSLEASEPGPPVGRRSEDRWIGLFVCMF